MFIIPAATSDTAYLGNRILHASRLITIGEIATGIAHDINQPLAAIANYARACDHLLASGSADFAELRRVLQAISAEALRAGDTILRFRRLVERPAAEREITDPNGLIEELSALILADARRHETPVRMELAASLPPIWADRAQLQHALLNLVLNGLEALSSVPATARQLTIRTAAGGGDIEISVSDNGPGLDPGIADRIFDQFCTTKEHGTGLGLPIARTILQKHGGTIDHRPVFPTGACFCVRIPGASAGDKR